MDDQGLHKADFISSLVKSAYQRIHYHLVKTPLLRDPASGLFLKCENLQTTGSFKWRGALSKLSTLSEGSAVVTASTGNHGLGVARAAELFELPVKVFIPAGAAPQKLEKLASLGVDLVKVEGDSLASELAGKEYAESNGLIWVSPYNDLDVIAGQGTIGLELTEQLDNIDKIYVTVGGGGLVSGIGGWMKAYYRNELKRDITIIGCLPVNSPEMYLSQVAGHVVNAPDALPTLSDGSAGPLEEDSITFDYCRAFVDRYMLITEEEIREAIRYLYRHHQLVVEGAAGVAFAAALKDPERLPEERCVVVLCGGNIDAEVHLDICSK